MADPTLFGRMADGTEVQRVVLQTEALRVAAIGYGAALQSIEHHGTNVVLGLVTLEDYVARSPHFGAVPGRYAGRIGGASFTLDGQTCHLPANDGPNTRHGGPHGFGKRPWTLASHGPRHASFTLVSADGDAGFPGELTATVTYTLDGADLHIAYHATTTRPTVINLTNHSYFNLAGEGSGSILDHELTIDADQFTPIDAGSIPTGEIRALAGTPLDFSTPHRIGARIREATPQLLMARGYDQAYLLRGTGLRRAALLREPQSGRTLEVLTTQPALQLYTANSLDGALSGPSGHTYRQSDAVCLETQHLADSPNQPHFPPTTLRPGETFASTTIFRFGLA